MIFGKYMNGYYRKHAGMLILGVLALALVDYFQLRIPEFYRMVINGMNTGYVETAAGTAAFTADVLLDEICLPLIITIVAMVFGRFLWRFTFFTAAVQVETDLRDRMFDHCKDLSQSYYQVNRVGNLMSLFTNDLETIQECFGDGALMFFDALLLGVMSLAKMLRMDALLTLCAMIPLLFLFAAGSLMGRTMVKKWEERQQAFSDLSDFTQEAFSGYAVIKAFVREARELAAFGALNRKNEEINVEYTKISTLLQVLVMLFVETVVCVILGYGGYLVWKGSFDPGQLVEFIGYFTSIVWPVMAVALLIEKTSRGRASLNRITQLLDQEIDVKDSARVRADAEETLSGGGIAFRNLTFRYPGGERDALTDVSFCMEDGEFVGIVGRTGAGKTTLAELILRAYNVPDGTVFVGGRDVNTVPVAAVRAACAYVPQDNFLFSDTIENNIGFAFDGKDPEAIRRAAVLSDVDGDIEGFAEKYQTVLGERGVTVSGGQKQRISIARALLKDSPILILDDSVSAVDTKTEEMILQNLRRNRAGRTTILIAHRISTVQSLDRILFLDDGRVAAFGPHDELYASCPAYRRMVDLQKLEDKMGGKEDA